MPGVLGQVGQNVADDLYEVGKGAVKGTADALVGVARGSVEQVVGTTTQSSVQGSRENVSAPNAIVDQRKAMEKRRFEEVRAEMARYIAHKRQVEMKIAEEKAVENQQTERSNAIEKKKKDSWLKNLINRSQTGTEKGRSKE